MDLKQFEAFQVIVSTGSFSIAARQLNLTQSALSHQIRNLESEIGQPLLVRTRPRVHATEAGRDLLTSINRILAELHGVREQFGLDRNAAPSGALRVAATYSGLTHLYGDLCEAFMRRHPGIELVFTATHAPDDALQRVSMRSCDVALGPYPADSTGLEALPLGTIEQVFVVKRGHPLARRTRVSIAQVRSHPFVRYQPRTGSRALADQLFLPDGGYPPIALESNDTEFMKRIVAMGHAVALMPAFTIARELRDGVLAALRPDSGPLTQRIGLFHSHGLRLRNLELFKAACLEARGAEPWNISLERAADRAAPKAALRVIPRRSGGAQRSG